MATSVRNSSSPGLSSTQSLSQEVKVYLLSTKSATQHQFLKETYEPGRTATNHPYHAERLRIYENSLNTFHTSINTTADILDTFIAVKLGQETQQLRIHAICDAAHTYTDKPEANPKLFQVADELLSTSANSSLFETNSYIPKSHFLSNGHTFRSLYFQHSQGRYKIAHYGPHFGNVLFRLTPHTGDMCFSPLFIKYLNRDLSEIKPKAYRYEDLAKDKHFYTKGSGFKTLTDRDAVAHYRWLTEQASGEKFTAYLASIGDQTDATSYSWEQRKALLEDLSKKYWRLGHGSLSHPSAAVAESDFQGAAVPLNLVHPHVTRHQDRELSRPCTPISVEPVFNYNPVRLVGRDHPSESGGYSADSENNEMPLQIHRYKRRPNPSVSRPTHLEDARSQSQGEYRRLLDTSSDGASSGSENSDDGRNHPSFRRDFVKEQIRDLYPGRSHRGDPQYPSRLWAPWHAAVLAPSASRTIKPEQPTKQPPFRYIAPSYVERITYMEPEKIIKPLYYIPVIQKRQKDMAYKIGSFFKKLLFAIRMR